MWCCSSHWHHVKAHLTNYIIQNVAYMFGYVSRVLVVVICNFEGLSSKCPNEPKRASRAHFLLWGLFIWFWGERARVWERREWDFDLPNSSIRERNRRGFEASPNHVDSHLLYIHLHSGLLARCWPWFFPARGFHVNSCVYLWFGFYLAILVDWFLSFLILVAFCSSSRCMDEIVIWRIHEFFDMLMMGIDVLVNWSLQVYSLLWSLDSTMFKKLMLWGCFLVGT